MFIDRPGESTRGADTQPAEIRAWANPRCSTLVIDPSLIASSGDHGFVRADADGAGIFLGGTELAKTGIKQLAAGDRIGFDIVADDRFGGTDRAVNVRVIYA